jgi:multiple sugar transport system permease protein/sn-glycerol 3-phosphate transport system permease protein
LAQLVQPANASPIATARSRKRVVKKVLTDGFFYALMTVLAVVFLAPLAWMITASLRPEREVLSLPPRFFPTDFEWGNYRAVWDVIPSFLWNSIKLAVINVIGVLFVASLAAYAFARLPFRGKGIAFSILLSTLMVPGIVTLIPLYIIYRDIGWIDTHYPLWVPRVLHSVFAIFLLRQFFMQIPMDLDDAARLDGASSFEIYWRIMLPQVTPALAAVAIFTFLDSWNDLFGPLIFLNDPDLQTLPVALKLFQGEYFSQVSVLMAGATISIIPVIFIYFAAQRYFLRGIVLTGLK